MYLHPRIHCKGQGFPHLFSINSVLNPFHCYSFSIVSNRELLLLFSQKLHLLLVIILVQLDLGFSCLTLSLRIVEPLLHQQVELFHSVDLLLFLRFITLALLFNCLHYSTFAFLPFGLLFNHLLQYPKLFINLRKVIPTFTQVLQQFPHRPILEWLPIDLSLHDEVAIQAFLKSLLKHVLKELYILNYCLGFIY